MKLEGTNEATTIPTSRREGRARVHWIQGKAQNHPQHAIPWHLQHLEGGGEADPDERKQSGKMEAQQHQPLLHALTGYERESRHRWANTTFGHFFLKILRYSAPAIFFNERFMAAQYEEGCYENNISIYFLFAKGYGTMKSEWQGPTYYRRYGRELVSNPAIS